MTHFPESPDERPLAELTGVVERNIRALLERRRADDHKRGWQDRLANGITRFTGSMRFVYLHLLVFGLWIGVNLPWSPLPRFDPSYVITQNRITSEADKRADLDLHISLLAEHEITRLIMLVQRWPGRWGLARLKTRSWPSWRRMSPPKMF